MSARKMTPGMLDQAAQLREDGWSIGRIAGRFNMSEGAISWHLLKAGADSPKIAATPLPQTAPGPSVQQRGGHTVRRFTPAEDAMILRMEADGCGHTAIGNACDPPRRPNSIAGRLMTLARHEARLEAFNASHGAAHNQKTKESLS